HSGRTIAGGDDLVGIIGGDHAQGEDPSQFLHRFANSVFKRRTMAVPRLEEILLHQMGDNLGIRFGGERVTFFDELALQGEIVLDNAVMHDHDAAAAVAMGMSILFAGAAMRGPAGVANAIGAVEGLCADDFLQVPQLAFRAADLESVAVAGYGDSGGIVSAIFQPSQAINDDRDDLLFANVADDATHKS